MLTLCELWQLLNKFLLGILVFITSTECRRSNWNFADSLSEDMGFHIDNSPLRDLFDNGAAQFLIDTYTNSIIDDLADQEIEKLTPHQTLFIKERLKGLYAFLKNHPALMDRRLKVGSRKPNVPSTTQVQPLHKRNIQHFSAVSVCPSMTTWRLLRYARDMNDTEVEVFQPTGGSDGYQWFYTVSCDDQHKVMTNSECPGCCRGINRRRYSSQCMTKKAFVMALVRPLNRNTYDWNWIQIDSSCNCAVSPKS